MEQAVVRLLNNGKVLEKELEKAHEGLVQFEARELIEKNNEPIINEVFQNRTIQELQKLARLITAEKADALVLFVAENDNRLQLVCARGAERLENMKNVMAQALALINGKGGGNDSFAQGGGDTIMFGEQMIRHLLEIVTENNKI
jgi:alanyl-tRNA synthetase